MDDPEPIDYLTTAGVAAVLGVSVRRVDQLASRRPDFPRPAAYGRGMAHRPDYRLWRPRDVEHWAATANRQAGAPGHRDRQPA